MEHCGTQELETDRLLLRRYVVEDAAAMYKNWASDEDVTRNYYHWTITLKDNGNDPIGDIAVVDVNRIESRHDPRNPDSGRVMKKCGMKYEGTLRSSDWNNQGICDACYYALLKSDFNVGKGY